MEMNELYGKLKNAIHQEAANGTDDIAIIEGMDCIYNYLTNRYQGDWNKFIAFTSGLTKAQSIITQILIDDQTDPVNAIPYLYETDEASDEYYPPLDGPHTNSTFNE